nr:cation acetate symporter [Propionicicella superfundia]
MAAPLRRSGAYTIPDFVEARLASPAARRVTSVMVVIIGWLYIVPQLHGAALAIGVVAGLPGWIGSVLVAVVVGGVVAAGGMRAITYVQAFHYWLKLTALMVPVAVMLFWLAGAPPEFETEITFPVGQGPAGQHPYDAASLMLGLVMGTMGLPHVLVRFYTNPDGVAARRTTGLVIVLIGIFYMTSSTMGLIARATAPDLADPGVADTVALVLPSRLLPGPVGDGLTALIVAGAFAAFLATSSGLVVSLAGVISQDLLGGGVRAFRVAALISAAIPLAVTLATSRQSLAGAVGLVFVFAASSMSPVLVLAVWWRRLTARGAIAGMVVGGISCGGAFVADFLHLTADEVLARFMAQPAAGTVPLAVVVTVAASLADGRRVPPRADRYLTRLHVPEARGGTTSAGTSRRVSRRE